MPSINNKLLIFLLLLLRGSSLPLASDYEKCLSEDDAEEDCYHDFDEVIADIGLFGESIKDLARLDDADEVPFNIETDTPTPTKKLTLKILERALEEKTSLVASPIGFLTKYGYVKGILKAMSSCEESEDIVHTNEIYASMLTFMKAQNASQASAWHTMNKPRCSEPDITFDEDGNLDEESAQIISDALQTSAEITEKFGELRGLTEHEKKRKRRSAGGRPILDLNEKNEYTYKLMNKASGLLFADQAVDSAFASWSSAIGSAVTFTRTDSNNPDVKLKFVADEHDDYTFAGEELAHAPFPQTEYHGNVHYRKNRDWDEESAYSVDFTYVTVHELGHYLGLKHSNTDGSVMLAILDSTTVPNEYSGKLHDSDISTVKRLYAAAGPSNCPEGWHAFEGVCYIADTVSAGVTWEEALQNCQKRGANLATVGSGPLDVYILESVANGRSPYWIGRKSSDEGWVNNEPFAYFPAANKKKQMSPKSTKCLRAEAYSGSTKWEFVSCNSKKIKTEHYVCQKNEEDFTQAPSPSPTTVAKTTEAPSELPTFTPCQNYIRGAIRRGHFLYIFGNTKYFKYLHTNSRPTLSLGYPKDIAGTFEGIPDSFSAVVTNPYDRDMIYFIDDQEVYEWRVNGKRSAIEDGTLKKRGKSGNKPKKLRSLFKTTNVIRGATVFDPNSIMLFAKEEVGRWHRQAMTGKKLVSKYERVEKWDYFESMGSTPIDAVTSSHFEKYIMFIRNDEYFLVRKSDGKIPKRFIRNLSSDFDKLEICDVIAPFIEDYPENIDPDEALIEEDL